MNDKYGSHVSPKAGGVNPRDEGPPKTANERTLRQSDHAGSDFGFRISSFFRPSRFGFRISTLPVISALTMLTGVASAQTLSDDALARVRFEQKLNAQVSLTLPFRDDEGNPVQLNQYFGHKPVLLVLGYYECPMLCTLVLNGMVESASDMKWSIGREFQVVDVSVNPAEAPALAAAKKRTYVKRYGRSGAAAGWHFLTGPQSSIAQLAEEVGFVYAYDPASKQYAHPSGLVVLTPEGKVSRYLFGVTFAPQTLYAALRDAGSNRVGSPIQQLILLCFHYNPITGKYSGLVIVILRSLGIATMLGFAWLIVALVLRGKSAQASLAAARQNPAQPALESAKQAPDADHATGP